MKVKLGVIFGGRSVEHEISIITANQAMSNINQDKYEIVPIYISKQGLMYTGAELLELKSFRDMKALIKGLTQITLVNDGTKINLVRFPMKKFGDNIINTIDVAFPTMHGTNGEDGSIAGFLETINVPYIGCDTLSASIGMDKIMMRRVLKEAGISSLDYIAFYSCDYIKDEDKYIKEVEEKLRYPVIVKAGNLGSSVGIKKAKDRSSLVEAIEYAMQFSDRVMIENAITNLKEVNCSVLGDVSNAKPSECEEPVGSDEILSYTDKYMSGSKTKAGNVGESGGAKQGMASLKRKLPAEISDEMKSKIQKMAVETFKVLGCNGVSRIDFLVDNDTNDVYVNEINTIPGALSYYLWEATGKSFSEEIDDLVQIALKRKRERDNLTFSYDQNILALNGNKIGVNK
ncbi:MAG: D-alanine--D-alanine ligase [Clostridia bacterium]|nr:D-alanine--D-alanine ligase [Clostridia bacterium]